MVQATNGSEESVSNYGLIHERNSVADPVNESAGSREFRRVYKACLTCQKRKSKCELDENAYATGRPCLRCRREMKECVFVEKRATPKRRKRSTNESMNTEGRHDPENFVNSNANLHGQPTHNTPTISSNQGSVQPATSPDGEAGPSLLRTRASAIERPEYAASPATDSLADSVMRTVVSSGNDAMNLLFEAARQEGDCEAQNAQGENDGAASTQTMGIQFHPTSKHTHSTNAPSPPPHNVRIPDACSDALEVWSACRFVKMGWFSAHEAIFYIDK